MVNSSLGCCSCCCSCCCECETCTSINLLPVPVLRAVCLSACSAFCVLRVRALLPCCYYGVRSKPRPRSKRRRRPRQLDLESSLLFASHHPHRPDFLFQLSGSRWDSVSVAVVDAVLGCLIPSSTLSSQTHHTLIHTFYTLL